VDLGKLYRCVCFAWQTTIKLSTDFNDSDRHMSLPYITSDRTVCILNIERALFL